MSSSNSPGIRWLLRLEQTELPQRFSKSPDIYLVSSCVTTREGIWCMIQIASTFFIPCYELTPHPPETVSPRLIPRC